MEEFPVKHNYRQFFDTNQGLWTIFRFPKKGFGRFFCNQAGIFFWSFS